MDDGEIHTAPTRVAADSYALNYWGIWGIWVPVLENCIMSLP